MAWCAMCNHAYLTERPVVCGRSNCPQRSLYRDPDLAPGPLDDLRNVKLGPIGEIGDKK